MKKIVAFILVMAMCVGMMISVEAKQDSETNLSILLEGLVHDGVLSEQQISTVELIEANIDGNAKTRSVGETVDAVRFTSEDGNVHTETYVVPFVLEDDGVSALALNGTATQKNLEYSDVIYVLSTATYIYYTPGETDYAGPFYRPTIVKTKWMNGSEVCTVSNINTVFMNRGYVVDLSTYEYLTGHVNRNSTVVVSNPTRGITYVGDVIGMDEDTALSMNFNGIDTYSYIFTDVQFTYSGVSDSRQISIPTFPTSGWYEE